MATPSAIPVPEPAAADTSYAKSRDTRARIFAAALEEAGESGFHKTSVARIAERAGVALGSLNYHFGSRAGLMRELMGQLMTYYTEWLESAEVPEGADYFARERAVMLAYAAHIRRHPSYARLAEEVKLHEPELYRRGERKWAKRMAARIRQGIDEGALRPMSEAETLLKAEFLVSGRRTIESLAQRENGPSDEEIVDACLDLERAALSRRHEGATA